MPTWFISLYVTVAHTNHINNWKANASPQAANFASPFEALRTNTDLTRKECMLLCVSSMFCRWDPSQKFASLSPRMGACLRCVLPFEVVLLYCEELFIVSSHVTMSVTACFRLGFSNRAPSISTHHRAMPMSLSNSARWVVFSCPMLIFRIF